MTRNTSTTRIVIATADFRCRASLLAALQPEPGFNVVGEASDGPGLVALRQHLQPDILLVDSPLAGLVNGAVSSWPAVRIILLATIIDEGHIIQALRLRARGIVPKTAPPQVVLKSIRSVLADQYWLGADTIGILVQMLRADLPEGETEAADQRHGLTAREHNIVAMIATGHSNKEISQELSISERTVKHHLTSIFGKLGLTSRLQLATFAVAHGLAPSADRATAALTVRPVSAARGQRKPLPAISLVGR